MIGLRLYRIVAIFFPLVSGLFFFLVIIADHLLNWSHIIGLHYWLFQDSGRIS